MNKIKLIIRLHGQGNGSRSISSKIGLVRNTVKKYLDIFRSSGMDYDTFFKLSDSEVAKMFNVSENRYVRSERLETLESLLPGLCKQLKRKGVTREELYKEYREKHPQGYGISSFNAHISLYLGKWNPVMHLDHKAGDKMYVDFTGRRLSITPWDSVVPVEVFVAILGCSQLTYVEAVASQKKEDFIWDCENALRYFGGVPLAIIPDNLKAAVTKGSNYEAIINHDFFAFADHYATTVLPARVYKPKDKSLVEGAVKLIYRSIFDKLSDRVFYDLESLNIAIRGALESHNSKPFYKKDYSRRDLFEEIEFETLHRLNPFPFELKKQLVLTVMKTGYIRLAEDEHYYSVPYKYIGKKVKVLYSSLDVEIYYQYELLATHPRHLDKYQYTTQKEHLASQHQYIADWSPDYFLKRALDIHEVVAKYINYILGSNSYPEKAYKACSGILHFHQQVGSKRLINACRLGDSLKQYSYLSIEGILKNGEDILFEQEMSEAVERQIPSHENIRGKEYFQ
ncbi:MAG: IS21 family transposase [Candidatus Symbiothrix sp.]|nr:IS21 family transposase [Candidatus Symbiothrix sp.]